MNRTARLLVFGVGAGPLAVLLIFADFWLPAFGGAVHPYRDRAVAGSLAHATVNAVSSVNFDQRALDTSGEMTILLAAVLGAATLLRPGHGERPTDPPEQPILDAVRVAGVLLLPVTVLVGLTVIAHGHLSPGGGFQGGVVLATGLHLLYVAGSYPALRRLRPLTWYVYAEAASSAAFVLVGLAGLLAGAEFLANVLPHNDFGALLSAGTVPLLNIVIGVEVCASVVVLLAAFLRAEVASRP